MMIDDGTNVSLFCCGESLKSGRSKESAAGCLLVALTYHMKRNKMYLANLADFRLAYDLSIRKNDFCSAHSHLC